VLGVTTATAQDVHPGTTWQNRKNQAKVLVLRTTEAGKVVMRKRDGKNWTMPVDAFVAAFLSTGELHHVCSRCGSTDLRLEDRYCKTCQAAIARFRNAAKTSQEEEPVLTTTDQKLIEQRRADAVAPPPPKSLQAAPVSTRDSDARLYRWRITGRVTLEIHVEGATVIDALGAAEAQYPDLAVTDVHLLD
jgi:ribosomal protein L37E